jgi:PAP2 superfamily
MQSSFAARTFHETLLRARAAMPAYLFIGLYYALGFLFVTANHTREQAHFSEYLHTAALLGLVVFPVCAVAADIVRVLHRFGRRRGLALRASFSPRRIGALTAGAAKLFAIMLFAGVFTSVKNTLAVWQGGFHYDRQLADLDALLHFGADPWRVVAPMMNSAAARMIVGYNYGVIWFLMVFGAVYFVASSPKADAVRSRYLLSFMLVWVLLGNVLAGLFMSAGPAFYGQATGDAERFSGLLALLANGDATQLYQAYLWRLHEAGQSGFASGISAFPSVHVGLAVMNACFAWDANRRLGVFAAVYALFVMASSVALGWHYAVDGYAAALIVTAMHVALKRLYARTGNSTFEGRMLTINVQ